MPISTEIMHRITTPYYTYSYIVDYLLQAIYC